MEKVKEIIAEFFMNHKMDDDYDMTMREWVALSGSSGIDPVGTTNTAFLYGYANGYRAAMAEKEAAHGI